ncbi:MAG: thiaminase (transcriptional activator TenA) [Chloroflexi bacterium]|jgi:thiaminase/transcriptional activator TenA|nr:MAG: thiaminase (transcriptional activator TenA) [Chloroflexota bacterium]
MTFSENLRRQADPIYRRIFEHPMVTGIGDGTLPVDRFKFYVKQDYLYLVEYAKVTALAVAKGRSLDTMGRLALLLHETLNTEMELHRSYCREFGISREELESTAPAPTTHAYTRHLLTVAYEEGFASIAASMAPCQWGYAEIGLRLAERGRPVHQPLYCQWVDMYASEEFQSLAAWLRPLVDEAAQELGPAELARAEQAFLTSARYEYLFWDMAWKLEEWPI